MHNFFLLTDHKKDLLTFPDRQWAFVVENTSPSFLLFRVFFFQIGHRTILILP